MVFFQFGNLDFMGSVSGNETKIAPQYKQLMNKLFIFVLLYETNSEFWLQKVQGVQENLF